MARTRKLFFVLAAAALLLCVSGCQSRPSALCNQWVDTFAEWGVGCGHFEDHAAAETALFEASPRLDSCADVERILLPDLWELECIPETRALACDAAEFPNACRGQLVPR